MVLAPCRYLFVFNFHPSKSYPHYHMGLNTPGEYQCVLDTDHPDFGGYGRVDATVTHGTWDESRDGKPHSICLYAPSCSAQVSVNQTLLPNDLRARTT